jgi:soluble lytic murein transglycosylase-like protein
MPGTAASLGVGNAWDVRANLAGAASYIKQHLDRHAHRSPTDQFMLALASYNAGPGAVSQYGGVPPYAETVTYIRRIAADYVRLVNESTAAGG